MYHYCVQRGPFSQFWSQTRTSLRFKLDSFNERAGSHQGQAACRSTPQPLATLASESFMCSGDIWGYFVLTPFVAFLELTGDGDIDQLVTKTHGKRQLRDSLQRRGRRCAVSVCTVRRFALGLGRLPGAKTVEPRS